MKIERVLHSGNSGQPTSLLDLDYTELQETFQAWGEPGYRVQQVWQGLYRNLWDDPADFSNLPKSLRDKLSANYSFSSLHPIQEVFSKDKETNKVLFELPHQDVSGIGVEAVLMYYQKRRTLCISTQVGCGMGCVFCATGQMGLRRNLKAGEIVDQVLYFSKRLRALGEKVSNIVFMGMGEPFQNYENTIRAIGILNHPDGMNIGARRMTISTVGLVPAIRRFTSEASQVNLAISLHAADDQLRSSLLPINSRYPLAELMCACQEYVEFTGRRISFEWALIQGVNDTLDQARKLSELLQIFKNQGARLCHVNIIPLNPTRGYSGEATNQARAEAFQKVLTQDGIPCTIRLRRGLDIQAGCGQLAIEAANIPS